MTLTAVILYVLALVWNICSEPAKPPAQMTVSDYTVQELVISGCCMRSDAENNTLRYYSGEIKGETAERLYEIVCKQYEQPALTGGNYLTGTPYLVIKAPGGQEYICSYTWDREEYTVDDYGQPGTMPAGTCFAITGTRSSKFQPTDNDTIKEFERLICDYLTENYEPSQERLLKKSAGTDYIVLVSRYTNYAWGKDDRGGFIDCYGNWYIFDFSDRDIRSDEEFFDALWEVYCNSEPNMWEFADSDKMYDILTEEIPQIDRSAEMIKKCSGGADMGQRTLYAVSIDGEIIELRSDGDWNNYLDDPAAKRIYEIYMSM